MRAVLRQFTLIVRERNRHPSFRASIASAVVAVSAALAAFPADARHVRKAKLPANSAKPAPAAIPPGQLHIIVSINDQRVSVYSDGALAARAPVSTGTATHPTPLGIFAIIQKRRHHRSNLYYNAPMPFMQRITWSGAALHAGVLPGYPASHGCVRLPEEFADLLWRTTKLGARVIIAREDVAPVPIEHPALFAPLPKPVEPDVPVAALGNPEELVLKDGRIQLAQAVAVISDAPEITAPKPEAPIAVFVSRADKRLYVRRNFEPLFSLPANFRNDSEPVGTHTFTAIESKDGNAPLRWIAVTMPGEPPKSGRHGKETKAQRREREQREARALKTPLPPPQTAALALDRLELTPDARQRIAELLVPGSSLIISDHGLHHETGKGTEFVVLTR